MCRWTVRVRRNLSATDVEKGHSGIIGDSLKISSKDADHENEKNGHDAYSDPWRSLTPPPLPPFPQVVHGSRNVAQPPDVQNENGNTDSGSSDPWRSLTPPPLPPFPEEWHSLQTGTALPLDKQSKEMGSDSLDQDHWRSLTPPPLPPFPWQEKHSASENTELLRTINAKAKSHASCSTSNSISSRMFRGLLAPGNVIRSWKKRSQG